MIEKTFSLLFYLKKQKNYLKGPMHIYMRITIDGIRKEISTGRQCDLNRWDSHSGRVIGTKEYAKSLNAYLDTLQTKVYEVRRQLTEKSESITAVNIKNLLKGNKEKAITVLKAFQDHNDQMKDLVGKEFSNGTLDRYKTSFQHTKAFIEWKYRVSDLDIKRLNYDFVSQYEFWLKTIRNCGHNTAIKYIANFRKIVNRCIKLGLLDKDPFFGYKMTKKEVVPEFLTEHELTALASKRLNSDRLNQVRDIFVFCCYTGLAFADVKNLKPSEIGIGIDGRRWIFTTRRKTNTLSRIPLLPQSLGIIEKYTDSPAIISSEKLLPVLSNQKYNDYLKEIAALCDISKNLTTHTARHTFATTVTLSNGVPIESVSKMLGHTNKLEFRIFINFEMVYK